MIESVNWFELNEKKYASEICKQILSQKYIDYCFYSY